MKSFRGRLLSRRIPRRLTGSIVLGLSLALLSGSAQAVPLESDGKSRPGVQDDGNPTEGKAAEVKPRGSDPARKAAVKKLDRAAWPEEGSAEIQVSAFPFAVPEAQPRPLAKPKADGLSVTATPADVRGTPAKKKRTDDGTPTTAPPATVRVNSLGHAAAEEWGSAALFTVERTDGVDKHAPIELSVDYSAFADGFGGDYGGRLRLIELPACAAAKAPGDRGCPGSVKELPSRNDADDEIVTAQVTADPDSSGLTTNSARTGDGGVVYALAAGDSSAQGDYKATPMSPSAKWSVAKSSGGFSWSYPFRTVPTPGGLTPTVGLSYSSQAVDGRTAATNNQGSWVGEGFSFEPGYIERRYKACKDDGHDDSAEQCWAHDNATLMLEGASGELIKDDDTGEWHLRGENGAKIEKLADTVNGDDNGEHWRVTTTDGTEYYFGLNRRPGWTSGAVRTNSTWTTPVFGDDPGEPCHASTFTDAWCRQAWRWNLDYVKDTHGNVMSYIYGKETNRYALNGKTDVDGTAYTRGGYLKRVEYGQRDGQVFDAKAPARVLFHTAERCLPTSDFDCAPEKFTEANAAHWPDTPVDRHCKVGTHCDATQTAATFWTRKRLTGITTQMRTGAETYQDVDAWTFTHLFTDNGDDSKTLWLSKIDHEGRVGGTAKLPSLELQGIQLVNRVDKDRDNIDPFHRFRLAAVLTETGAQLDVNYAPTECSATALPQPGESTKRCYPVRWTPPGHIDPITDWFHKYVVAEIIETDRTGGSEDLVTRYDYQGPAGWRRAEPDGITDKDMLTWGQWQGYGDVSVTSGNGETMKTRVDYTYLQGLHGDKDPAGGTRSVTVNDSTGETYTDHKEFTGFELEAVTYDGTEVVSKVITEPWKRDTATQTKPWKTIKATLVKPKITRGYTGLGDGSWRKTKSTTDFDASTDTGRAIRIEDLGDLSTPEDDKCTRLWYADNSAKNLYELPSRSEAVSVACGTTPDRATQVIADERTYYDGGAFGDAPSEGDATKTERLKSHDGTTASYQVTGTTSYDAFGRPTSQTDASGATTTTEYTDVNGLISQTKVTNELGHVTTTDYAPAWGQSTGQTDPNDKRTDLAYDPLGRLVSVWMPDRSKTQTPSIKYSYLVRRDQPVAVKTEKIEISGSYGVEYQLYDGLLRPRQKQTEGPDGTRMVADTLYDGTGKIKKTNTTYNAVGAPSDTLLVVTDGEVGAQSRHTYDGLGRPTAEIFSVAGTEQWRTTYQYEGDRTHIDPPDGGVPQTRITDSAGRTTELRYHHGDAPVTSGPGTGYDTTTFDYTPGGELAKVTDDQGNTWEFTYDQRGRRTESVDPDTGTTTTVYDVLDRPVSSTDARGEKTSKVYDELGRVTSTWEGEPTSGTKLTETRYDKTGWLGKAWASFRYVNGGSEYFATVTQSMDDFYRPLKTAYSVPDSEGALAGVYTFTRTYNRDGTLQGIGMPAAGKLPSEGIVFGYDDLQRPTSMTGDTSYVTDAVYSDTSLLQQLELSTGSGKKLWQTFHYEKGTDRLTRSVVDQESATAPLKDAHYSYDQAGNVLSISDTAGGATTPDVQCFAYDHGMRLAEAWTPQATAQTAAGSGTVGGELGGARPEACDGAPGTQELGGPAPYWKSYTVDSIGNRTQEVVHDTGLDAAQDVTRTYTYGEGAAGPHAVTKVVEDGPAVDRQSTYAYDATGNTTERVVDGDTQTLEWNAEGKLTKTTEADGSEATYVYDADGNRLVRRDGTAATVYLPGMELRLAEGSSTVEATRYYTFGERTVAVRTDDDAVAFLAADHHGTAQLAVEAGSGAVSQRRFDPYGLSRGQATGEWPGEKGFVGGTIDAQTGLTHIGAREYDAELGKFISVDPLIDYSDPQQSNGYAYGNNNPTTLSDPTGQFSLPFMSLINWAIKQVNKVMGWSNNNSQEVQQAQREKDRAERQYNSAKQRTKQAADELVDIAKEELGIDAAMDCFSSGDLAACGETALNVAGSFVGGLAGKILAKYGAPWNWKKGAKLAKRVWGLLDDLIGGARDMWSRSTKLDKAKDKLAAAKAKAEAKVGRGRSKCNSFIPGTPVLMADGSTKAIEDVDLGDEVVATDPENGETSEETVTAEITGSGGKNLVRITIDLDGNKGDKTASITATDEHPFWIPQLKEWLPATELAAGQWLKTSAGTHVQITALQRWTEQATVHNLTIADKHTYYVLAGDAPVLVHNDGGESVTDDFNQARNQALDWLSSRGFKAEKVTLGKFGTIKGKPVGMQTANGKVGFRIEFDDRSGAHINVWAGKEKGPHFQFNATEATVTKLQGLHGCG